MNKSNLKIKIYKQIWVICLLSICSYSSSLAQSCGGDVNLYVKEITNGMLGNILATNPTTFELSCNDTNLALQAELTVSGAMNISYTWNTPDGPIANDATINITSEGTYTLTVSYDLGGITQSTVPCSVDVVQLSLLVATIDDGTSEDVSCNGASDGKAYVAIMGGEPPYTYQWDNSETGSTATTLNAGMHTVTVTDDDGCTATDSIIIGEPDALVATPTNGSVSCNGDTDGMVSVSVSGGTPSYNYQWDASANNQISPTATNLGVGTYTVTVTDSRMCTTTATATVSEPSALSLTFTTTPASCSAADGQATATANGGTSPYTYLWDAGTGNQTTQVATMLTAGSYNVTVTDTNNCPVVETVEITSISTLMAQASTVVNATCNSNCDGQATVMPSGGNQPYTYLWNDNNNQTTQTATGLCAGDYIATVMDAFGCVATQPFTVTEPDELAINVNSITASCDNDASGAIDVQVTGGTTTYTYQWDNNAGIVEDPSGLSGGTYNLMVTDSNGCQKSQAVNVPINPTQQTTLNETICPGQSYTVGGSTYTMPGNYTDVLTTYLGCDSTVTLNLTVEEIQVPTDLEQIYFGNICSGQVITVEDPNDTYEYVWRTDASGEVEIGTECTALNIVSDPTNFFLDIKTSTGTCVETVPFTVDLTVAPDPNTKVLRIGQTNTLFCNRNDFASYQWGRESRTTLCPEELPGETFQNYVAASIDTSYYYWVMVEDTIGGCTQKLYYGDDPFMKVIPEEPVDYGDLSLQINPNPNDGTFQINLQGNEDKALEIYLHDVLGREMYYQQFDKLNFVERVPVALHQLNRGIYFVRVTGNKGTLLTEKIIIK